MASARSACNRPAKDLPPTPVCCVTEPPRRRGGRLNLHPQARVPRLGPARVPGGTNELMVSRIRLGAPLGTLGAAGDNLTPQDLWLTSGLGRPPGLGSGGGRPALTAPPVVFEFATRMYSVIRRSRTFPAKGCLPGSLLPPLSSRVGGHLHPPPPPSNLTLQGSSRTISSGPTVETGRRQDVFYPPRGRFPGRTGSCKICLISTLGVWVFFPKKRETEAGAVLARWPAAGPGRTGRGFSI